MFVSLFPLPVLAATEVPLVVSEDAVWNKEGSPYRISGFVTVKPGVHLSVEPGVVVEFADYTHLQVQQGMLSVAGSAVDPVVFTGSATSSSWALDVFGPPSPASSAEKSFEASHLRMENAFQGLYLQSANAVLTNVEIVGGEDGIYLSSSTLALLDSQLVGMKNSAISADTHSSLVVASTSITDLARAGITMNGQSYLTMRGVHMDRLGRSAAVGIYNGSADIQDSSFANGAGAAIEVYGNAQSGESQVSIHHSAISNFRDQSIYNGGHTVVSAERNWWGSKDGPRDAVYGPVSSSPWLLRPPTDELGDSSVVFIPGIQATRLVKDGNQLWEPNRNADVEKLYLDSAGRAVVSGVTTSSIIDSVNSVGVGPNIYKSFMQQLDSLVAQKHIREWVPLPYDWRFSASDAASDDAVEMLEAVANSSFTGKVSLVAHSNGGLVTKHLLRRLAERGFDIVDKVIFVATPQLGTPQAIASVLHGDGLQFAGGLILKQSVGRRLAQYSPGALGLLPTQEYFDTVTVSPPIIRFAYTTDLVSMNFFQAYGDRIDSASRLTDFLAASIDKRTPPDIANPDTPAVIDRALLASSAQRSVDRYPPAEVSVISGWGLDTLSAIQYSGQRRCTPPAFSRQVFSLCSTQTTLHHDPVFTRLGDKTVVLMSTLGLPAALTPAPDRTYFVDLSGYNAQRFRVSRNHADLLEVPQVASLIASMLHTPIQSNEATGLLPEYVATTSPNAASLPRQIRVSVHSPVSLNLYDEEGRHTGLVASSTQSDVATSSPLFGVLEELVPGSQYYHFGEAKYLSFAEPLSLPTVHIGTTSRTLQIRSIGSGLLTVDVEYVDGDNVIDKTSFTDIPVTPLTNISAQVVLPLSSFDLLANGFSLRTGATTTTQQLVPDQVFSPVEYLSSVRQVIREICMSQRLRLELLARLNTYINLFERGELPVAQAQLKEMVIISNPDVVHILDTPEERGSYISAVEAMLSRIASLSGGR